MSALPRALFLALMMALAGAATALVRPVDATLMPAPDLDAMLPDAFGRWTRAPLGAAVLPAEATPGPGEAVAVRAYADDLGRLVTLVAAYGPPRGDSVRLHRPETCYGAQGYAIAARRVDEAAGIPVVALDAQSPLRREAVTYWLREGDAFTVGPADSQWGRLTRGLAAPPDGALVRVSSTGSDDQQFALHRDFIEAFTGALSPEARRLLAGGAP